MNLIFIESGKPESNEFYFIKDIVFATCNQNLGEHYDIVNVGGFTNLPVVKSKFLDHKSPDEKNLVIFDADYPETAGGFEDRKKNIRQYGKELEIEFELFLFPNNKANGIFETLLRNLVKPEYDKLIQYFEQYETQVKEFNKTLEEDTFASPDEKAKIYSYISAFKRSQKEQKTFKKDNWDFSNKRYWNLESDYLEPLKAFFRKHLTSPEG